MEGWLRRGRCLFGSRCIVRQSGNGEGDVRVSFGGQWGDGKERTDTYVVTHQLAIRICTVWRVAILGLGEVRLLACGHIEICVAIVIIVREGYAAVDVSARLWVNGEGCVVGLVRVIEELSSFFLGGFLAPFIGEEFRCCVPSIVVPLDRKVSVLVPSE